MKIKPSGSALMSAFVIAYLSVVCGHILTATLLALRRASLPPYHVNIRSPSTRLIKTSATCTALWTLYVTVAFPQFYPLADAGVRAATFFYALKIIDLGVLRADRPPTRLLHHAEPAPMTTKGDMALYVWGLLSELRYFSFDSAVRQPARSQAALSGNRQWFAPSNVVPAILIVGLTLVMPTAEMRALFILLAIQWGFEAGHSFLHQGCPQPFFDRPFMAASMGAFWTTHWHAFASSTLRNLAYDPVKRHVGRAAGVLATFCLSGTWHAFAVVNISSSPRLPWMVFGLFCLFGILCGFERVVWGANQGGLLQRVFVWSAAIWGAGQCFRELECHSMISGLKRDCSS